LKDEVAGLQKKGGVLKKRCILLSSEPSQLANHRRTGEKNSLEAGRTVGESASTFSKERNTEVHPLGKEEAWNAPGRAPPSVLQLKERFVGSTDGSRGTANGGNIGQQALQKRLRGEEQDSLHKKNCKILNRRWDRGESTRRDRSMGRRKVGRPRLGTRNSSM